MAPPASWPFQQVRVVGNSPRRDPQALGRSQSLRAFHILQVIRTVYLLLWTALARGSTPSSIETRAPRPQVSVIRCRNNGFSKSVRNRLCALSITDPKTNDSAQQATWATRRSGSANETSSAHHSRTPRRTLPTQVKNSVRPDKTRRRVTPCHASAQCCEPIRVRHAAKNCVPEDAAVRLKDQRWLMLCLQCAETARNPSREGIVSDTIPDSSEIRC